MRPRLYLPALQTCTDLPATLSVEGESAHYLSRVLRLTPGDSFECFDGQGGLFFAKIAQKNPLSIRLEKRLETLPPDCLHITIGQCCVAGSKMDWFIEKSVELGANRLQLLLSLRRKEGALPSASKQQHWQRLIEAASAQCGQNWLPKLLSPLTLHTWLSQIEADSATKLVLTPDAAEHLGDLATRVLQRQLQKHLLQPASLPAQAKSSVPVYLLVGPESGFSPDELAQTKAAGFQPVHLGQRILRAETAGLAALAILHGFVATHSTLR